MNDRWTTTEELPLYKEEKTERSFQQSFKLSLTLLFLKDLIIAEVIRCCGTKLKTNHPYLRFPCKYSPRSSYVRLAPLWVVLHLV